MKPSHSADLVAPQLDRYQYKPEGVIFLPGTFAKRSSQGKVLREFCFPSFPLNTNLCPLQQHETVIASLQRDHRKPVVAIKIPQAGGNMHYCLLAKTNFKIIVGIGVSGKSGICAVLVHQM